MAAVLVNGHTLHPTDDYTRSVSQASTPASPAASFILQQGSTTLPSINLSGPAYVDYHSQPPTPTSVRSDAASLDPPPGTPFADFLRTWSDDVVAEWLATIKCAHQSAVFKAHDIRGDVLLELDQFTLKEMGIHSVGDRIRIIAAVKKLRQRCSQAHAHVLSPIVNRPPPDHGRRGSDGATFPSPSPASRSAPSPAPTQGQGQGQGRRLETARPAPLHLTPNTGVDGLPRLIRDGQESATAARAPMPPPIRPLPQPNATAHSAGARNIPPPPRSQPPVPNARTPRSHLIPPGQLSVAGGRRTPTLPEPPAFNTNQPLPPAPNANLLTPSADGARATPTGARPRPQSPLSQMSGRGAARGAAEHGRNKSGSGSGSGLGMGKPSPRAGAGSNAHPYAQSSAAAAQQSNLSPITEGPSGSSRNMSGTHSPPTASAAAYRTGNVVRPNTPSHTPSLDDIRRKVVKFSMPDEGKSSMIQVLECTTGAEVLERALKKLKGVDDGPTRVEIVDGALTVDGWAVFLDESQRTPLTEEKVLSICQAPPDEPAREHGLTLRNIRRGKPSPTSPRFTAFPKASSSSETLDETLLSPEARAAPTPGTKAYKRASSVSILSGLGVQIPDAPPSPSSSSAALLPAQDSPSKSPSKKGKLRNFFGQRPPSELITTHLAEYFPFTEKKVLERTRRQSMMRQSSASGSGSGMGLVGRRDSIISWNPPARSQSRFSVSTQGSGLSRVSPRNSIASGFSYAGAPPQEAAAEDAAGASAPRVSISTDDGRSVDTDTTLADGDADAEKRASRRMSRPHLLPPVAFPSESLAESLNLAGSRPGSRMSTASSRRMSYITELRSKRDRSDTASMLTVDEITAEVESRRESMDGTTDVDTDGWTAVESSEADAKSIKEMPEEEEEEEEEEDNDDATDVTVTDDEEPGKAITSRGERTIKWIKGALIGAGSFGKVYLGMDASTGLLMAVKQVELPSGSAPNDERKKSMLSALEREIALLKDLHHENIVQYLSSSVEDDHLNIFLEYVPGGSVTSLLRRYGAFEEPLVRNWVRQILLGLNYLHERDIIHRDIKGANMLVDNKGGIKISDFGISKKLDDNLMNQGNRAHRPSLQGSVFWMAPEVVKQTAYTQKADIWSIGCLVVEMLTGEHPYPQLSQMQAIFKIGMSSKPTIPADISPEAEHFLQRTFELDHEARPSAAELLKHPWIVASQPFPGA